MFECDLAHCRSVHNNNIVICINLINLICVNLINLICINLICTIILCMLHKSDVTRCTLFMAIYHIGPLTCLLAAEPRGTAGLLFHCQYLCGTTPYLMVWDWLVSRAGPMPFYWPSCLLPFYLLLFSFSFFSFYGLVLWGWGLRTGRVSLS